jgi:hypothetical protein
LTLRSPSATGVCSPPLAVTAASEVAQARSVSLGVGGLSHSAHDSPSPSMASRRRRNATKLRLSRVWSLVRQPRTCRSKKINMSRELRPYNCRVSFSAALSHGRLHLGCTYADYLIHVLSQRAWSRAHGLVVRVTPNLPHEPWTEGTARLAARTRIRRWPIDRTAGARRSGPLDRGKTSAAAAAITRASGQRGPPRACSSRLLRVSPHRVPLSRPAAQAGPPASGWARVVSAAGGNAGLRPVLLLFSTASPGLAPWHGR